MRVPGGRSLHTCSPRRRARSASGCGRLFAARSASSWVFRPSAADP
jgi:hypothetical protein